MTDEELRQKIELLEQQIKDLKVKLEEKAEKKPYEVEVPTDIYLYYTVNDCGEIRPLSVYTFQDRDELYKRGLTFKTEEEARQYDKKRILLFKLHKWAEEHNGGWTPDWSNFNETKHYITCKKEVGEFDMNFCRTFRHLIKLPYFKSEELAEQFIEEFGDEIKEVLC
mgnify:CR=1 FL=1|jgi:hypothetical protein